jgi:hypothetical protein
MASHTMSPSLWSGLGARLSGLARRIEPHADTEPAHEIRRAERALINEIIWSNPDAFTSHLDLFPMLQMYSGRY